MSFLSRFGRKSAVLDSNAFAGAIRIGMGTYNSTWSHQRVLNTVYRNPTGYRAIESRASQFMRPPWAVYKVGDENKPLDTHPVLKILNKPGERMSGTDMQAWISRDLDMNGGTFWVKVRGNGKSNTGPLTGLKRLAPHRVATVTNADDELLGYIYVDRMGEKSPFLPEEMIYVYFPDGDRTYDRMAPGIVAGLPADMDNAAMRFNAELLDNDAGLPGYLVVDGLTPRQFQEWVTSWRSGEQPGKTRVLSSGGGAGTRGNASYVRVGITNQEMMYDKLRDYSREDICRALGYPKLLLDPTDATFANLDNARRNWVTADVAPLWVKVSDAFSMALVDDLGSDDLRVGFDLSDIQELQENLDDIVTRSIPLLAAGVIVKTEVRRWLGLSDKPEGGFPEPAPIPPALAAANDPNADNPDNPATNGDNPPTNPKDPAKSALQLHSKSPAPRFMKAISKDGQPEPYAGWHDAVVAKEDHMKTVMTDFYTAQIKAVAARIRSKKGKAFRKALEDWWDGDKWDSELTDTYKSVTKAAISDFGPAMMTHLDTSKAWDDDTNRIDEYLSQRSGEFATQVNGTTAETIRSTISDIAGNGGGVDDIADGILDYFLEDEDAEGTTLAVRNATRVARTEMIGAANYSSLEAAYQSDLTLKKAWLAASTADEECLDLAGMDPVPLDDDFGGYGEPPAHPNCRCTITFEVQDD